MIHKSILRNLDRVKCSLEKPQGVGADSVELSCNINALSVQYKCISSTRARNEITSFRLLNMSCRLLRRDVVKSHGGKSKSKSKSKSSDSEIVKSKSKSKSIGCKSKSKSKFKSKSTGRKFKSSSSPSPLS